MNHISEAGKLYKKERHMKRTSKYFSPIDPIVYESLSVKEENELKDDELDSTDILLEGYRQPEILHAFLSTSTKPGTSITSMKMRT